MRKLYDRETLRNMPWKEAKRLPKGLMKIYYQVKKRDEIKKVAFLKQLKKNVNKGSPYTDKFAEKHLYGLGKEKLSKEDLAYTVAGTREFDKKHKEEYKSKLVKKKIGRNKYDNKQVRTKKKSSTIIMSPDETKTELLNCLDKLKSDDLVLNKQGECKFKKGVLFVTNRPYPIIENTLLFSRKAREMGESRRKHSQAVLGIRLENNQAKIHHFEKSV